MENVPIVHTFDPPERFVAGTVGEPGERTFFLQAREGARVVSVALEKQQVIALAERMDQLLDELMKSDTREVVPAVAPLTMDDAEPLEQPIVEEFRAGTMTLSWDPDDERVVIEVFPFTEAAVVSPDQIDEDIEEPEPDELLLVRLPAAAARSFVQRAEKVVEAGRPSCPFCGSADGPRGPPLRASQRVQAPRPVTLLDEELRLHGRIMPASNATFVGEIGDVRVVYKPVAGERPLWDFPDGTLANREVAAYVVSEALGWDLVPRTFLREGPHGPGMVQVWQEPDEQQAAVTVVAEGAVPAGYRHVFDGVDELDEPISLVHEDSAGAAPDGGLRRARQQRRPQGRARPGDGRRPPVRRRPRRHLPHDPKLRTVLWGWAGEPLDRRGGRRGRAAARRADRRPRGRARVTCSTERELARLRRRAERLLAAGRFPEPRGDWPAIPWPPF